jgi:hypothetical protein
MTGRPLQLEVAAVPRLALNGEEACAALGVSWDFFKEHVAPELPIVRRGRRKLVAVSELERWLDEHGEPLFKGNWMGHYLPAHRDRGRRQAHPHGRDPADRRAVKGVKISTVPVAAAIWIDGGDGDVVIATTRGKIERVAISSIPVRRRRVTSAGRVARGVCVVRLSEGDRVASAEVAPPETQTCPQV